MQNNQSTYPGDDEVSRSQSQNSQSLAHGGGSRLNPTIMLILGIVLLAGGFVGGMQYQKGKSTTVTAAVTQPGRFSGGTARTGGFGTVTAVSNSSITITQRSFGPNSGSGNDSTSKTYSISSTTTITDSGNTVTATDIQTGDTVMIRTSGKTSTVATAMQVNPTMGGGVAGPGTGTSTTGTSTATGSTSSI